MKMCPTKGSMAAGNELIAVQTQNTCLLESSGYALLTVVFMRKTNNDNNNNNNNY